MAELLELVLLLDGIVKCSDHFSPIVHKFSRNTPNSRCAGLHEGFTQRTQNSTVIWQSHCYPLLSVWCM